MGEENTERNCCTPSRKTSLSLRRLAQNLKSLNQFSQTSPVTNVFQIS